MIYNEISIDYGIPSAKQLSQSAKDLRKYTDPELEKHPDPIEAMMYDPNYTPVRLPTPDEYEMGLKLWKKHQSLYEKMVAEDLQAARINSQWDDEKFAELLRSRKKRLSKALSKQFQMRAEDVDKAKEIVARYYLLGWGRERVDLAKKIR